MPASVKPKKPAAKKARRPLQRRASKRYEWNGTIFASQFEVDFAKQLTDLGMKWEYEVDTFYWLPKPRLYKPDFKVYKEDGTFYYVETKGYFDGDSRAKMAAIKHQYPSYDIRMVFQVPEKKLSKSPKSKTYSEWAAKLGYVWSAFRIPFSWRNNNE